MSIAEITLLIDEGADAAAWHWREDHAEHLLGSAFDAGCEQACDEAAYRLTAVEFATVSGDTAQYPEV